jgi:hypothetical protein
MPSVRYSEPCSRSRPCRCGSQGRHDGRRARRSRKGEGAGRERNRAPSLPPSTGNSARSRCACTPGSSHGASPGKIRVIPSDGALRPSPLSLTANEAGSPSSNGSLEIAMVPLRYAVLRLALDGPVRILACGECQRAQLLREDEVRGTAGRRDDAARCSGRRLDENRHPRTQHHERREVGDCPLHRILLFGEARRSLVVLRAPRRRHDGSPSSSPTTGRHAPR